MTTVKEQVKAWYQQNIKPEELDKKVRATLDYVKRFNEPEDGEWVVWAYEVTSGAHGQYTVRIFLNEVTSSEDYTDEQDLDVVMFDFASVSREMGNYFTKQSKLVGTFTVGHNEADGSLGLFYGERA